jgi:predicted XRE-type DNA-binding protein
MVRFDRGHGEAKMTRIPAAKDPTRNVWPQLGLPDAEEHYLKAELVFRLDKAIKVLGLTQRAAARRLRTTQPELSKILRGKFSEVSLERLMRFLTALGQRIEIKIGAAKKGEPGEVVIGDIRRRAA